MIGQPDGFDVAIIGSGPAGASAAIRCCQSGLRVLIIEVESFPRYRPGESLHPGIEPLLRMLGVMGKIVDLNVIRYSGHWIFTKHWRQHVPFGDDDGSQWQGFQLWRADLDGVLLQKAIELGCTVWQPCRANRPLVENDRVVGVVTDRGTTRCRFLVDASGRSHWLGRHLDLRVLYCSSRLTVEYGYDVPDAARRDRGNDPTLWLESNSWLWEARVREDLYHWCRLRAPRDGTDSSIGDSVVARRSPLGRVDVTWRNILASAGPGYFITGDAAAVIDPTSSHGVLRAIMSGMMVAHAITAVENNAASELTISKEYSQWLSAWFKADVTALSDNYLQLGFNMNEYPNCSPVHPPSKINVQLGSNLEWPDSKLNSNLHEASRKLNIDRESSRS